MGNSGPFRGELGEVTEGSIRTAAMIRWPGKVKPNTTTYAMFSIMDFLPTFASIVSSKLPTDRPIDGVDQTDVLLGDSAMGHRDNLLSFIGADLVAARWKQWLHSISPTFTPPASDRNDSPAFFQQAPKWRAIRRCTTSKWTRTRT